MTTIQQQRSPGMYAAIAASLIAVAVADYFTALGIAVWIFYLLPVVLTLFLWRPQAPFVAASAATVLLAATFLTDEAGVDPRVAMLNRAFGLATVWLTAVIGNQFIRTRLAVRKDQWMQTAQTQLSERMAGDQQLPELGDNILKFLAEYTGAQAGAIFIHDSGVFRRFATYAVPPEAKVPERFLPGEGLAGQAAKDARSFVVHDVPEGELAIGSTLGWRRPPHLVIASFAADHAVNAVIELGYLRWSNEATVELLRRVGESIAVAIRSSRFRTQLQELLEETQRQAEELQAQTEELRVSNEELEEQGRALKESQARLEQQQAELEQTNAHLEQQTQLLEAQKSELGRAKNELEKRSKEVEQASRYKSEFLANMSHELRTPLNSSLILSKLLADNKTGNLTAEQVKYAQTIQSAGNDLLALINDVLDLSKIEAGRMEVHAKTVGVREVVENLRATFNPIALQKGLKFDTRIGPGAPEEIETDPQRLEQVLKNLLSNAFKFTDHGGIRLEVERLNGDQMRFAVTDTGIGIAEDQQRIIFEPFCQADGTTNRKYGGTGLGLAISRDLAHLLGGRITVASEPGRGSMFAVELPVSFSSAGAGSGGQEVLQSPPPSLSGLGHVPEPAPAAAVKRPARRARKFEDDRERLTGDRRVILVVEDDEAFAEIIYNLARELGFNCLAAAEAEEAIALALQYNPSAVVLDVGLPDHSGLWVLDRLKKDNRTRHIPVHVVSASDYAQTALSLGAVGYLLKPVKREQLVDAFERLETTLTRKMRRVLVVEDDPVQLESVRQLLGSAHVETVGVTTAAECLESLKSATFDCMVLDLSLPDRSGLALLETLSNEDAYSFPPVIVYTGRDLASDEEEKLRRYSKSIIIKGAKSPERLLDEVTLFLHQMVEELPPEQQKMLEAARNRDATLEGRRILIVEDDVRNIFAITSVLEPHGVRLVIARNGREAIEALERSERDAEPVDLVLMDIMMPEMDGLTAMREIRKRPGWKKLPIISLTAKAMKNDQEQCLEAGANDYMAKPLDVDKLLSLVRVWMPR